MQAFPKNRWRLIAVFTLAFAAVSAPMLAQAPQNPDGAEIVLAAIRGGVLHPPGYPLQTWLGRLLVHLIARPSGAAPPLSSAALALEPGATRLLAAQSLACLTGALALLGIVFLRLGASGAGACFGLACFAYFPATWRLAVQPEKYALFFLLVGAFAVVASGPTDRTPRRKAATLGVLFGLLLSQHVIGVLALPLAWPLFARLPRRERASGALSFAAGVILVPTAFYASLLLATSQGAWPDWGKLRNLNDLARHVTRRDLGFFTVDPTERAGTSALEIFVQELWYSFSVALLFLPLGLWAAARRGAAIAAAWAAAFVAAIFFVAQARSGGYPEVVVSWLERYTAVPMLFAAGFFALGWSEAERRLPAVVRWVAAPAAGAWVVFLFASGHVAVDASRDLTIDVYARALGELLPSGAFYTSAGDLEYFYGAETPGGRRFPVYGEYEWYRARAMPLLEPRLEFARPFRERRFETDNVRLALAKGFPVYTTTRELVEGMGGPPSRRGLFWVLLPRAPADPAGGVLAAAKTLCATLGKLPYDPPARDHFYSRYLWQQIGLAFMDSSEELGKLGSEKAATAAAGVAYAAATMRPIEEIHKSCEELIRN